MKVIVPGVMVKRGIMLTLLDQKGRKGNKGNVNNYFSGKVPVKNKQTKNKSVLQISLLFL